MILLIILNIEDTEMQCMLWNSAEGALTKIVVKTRFYPINNEGK